jgi:hypothetical protein
MTELQHLANTFTLMTGAYSGRLPTPVETTFGRTGTEAEARGSARFIKEEIEEAGYGYSVEFEYLGTDTIGDMEIERHEFDFRVTQEDE